MERLVKPSWAPGVSPGPFFASPHNVPCVVSTSRPSSSVRVFMVRIFSDLKTFVVKPYREKSENTYINKKCFYVVKKLKTNEKSTNSYWNSRDRKNYNCRSIRRKCCYRGRLIQRGSRCHQTITGKCCRICIRCSYTKRDNSPSAFFVRIISNVNILRLTSRHGYDGISTGIVFYGKSICAQISDQRIFSNRNLISRRHVKAQASSGSGNLHNPRGIIICGISVDWPL